MSLITPKKSLGQHWLTDVSTLEAMCQAVDVNDKDTVLEIGPGTGTLTRELVKRAKKVVAVEYDDKLAQDLLSVEQFTNLQIVNSDILKFNLTTLPKNYKVVANIPYYLTSILLRTLCESSNPPKQIALLVQKEVAERVAAKPGAMSLLSVSVQYYYEVSLGQVVPAKLFTPPPKVDSQILIMSYRIPVLYKDVDSKKFFQLVKAGFMARRKTLLNSLSGGLRIGKAETTSLLESAGISPQLRPQELSLGQWYLLYNKWHTK